MKTTVIKIVTPWSSHIVHVEPCSIFKVRKEIKPDFESLGAKNGRTYSGCYMCTHYSLLAPKKGL